MLVIILTYMKKLLLFIIIYTHVHENNNALSKSLQLFNKINVLQKNAPEELLAQKKEHGVETIHKVLDMRGPQVRVLTNLENLNAEMKAINDKTPMLELEHNVKLILDKVEVDV
jgi:tuftelin-interacting protein 11